MNPEDDYTGMHDTPARRRLRRVVIEERQEKTLEHARTSLGYAADTDAHGHDQNTFRLINQRKALDQLPNAEFIVPALDQWKHWSKMDDWDSRNGLLEQLTGKLRRREAHAGEIQLLILVCRPTWAAVAASLRGRAGLDHADIRSESPFRREEARRVDQLDRAELDQVIQHALLDALRSCPRPFPPRFFPWLKEVLSYRALDHVREELGEHDTALPEDVQIHDVLDSMLHNERAHSAASFAQPASPAYAMWLRTFDLPRLFELAEEFAPYARTRVACERAIDRLPARQKEVVQAHYFEATPQADLAKRVGVAASTVRNTHRGALRNLRQDDELFRVLDEVGKVRDRARRLQLVSHQQAA
jgi:RNA polymerase sigma factor (sigma-70 family)